MDRLIELALDNTRAVTVAMLAIVLIGLLCLTLVPVDILPVYDRPAVQVLTFYNGMPAENIANAITNRMERWAGQASGMRRQESRSILGTSIVRNYFHSDIDPSGALTQVNSLALAEIPNLPPGTLPPIVLPYDPTDTVPSCIVAVDSKSQGESTLYDVARYEVRNFIMASPGANAPVVFGGKVRCILAYIDPVKLQARGLSPVDVMDAMDRYNVFLPTGDAKFGTTDYAIDSNSMFKLVEHMKDIPLRVQPGKVDFLGDVAVPKDTNFIQTNIVRIDGKREVYIPVFKQHGASTLNVVDDIHDAIPSWAPRLTSPGIDLKLVMDQSVYVRQSIKSLAIEGILGAVLCSLVILLFLGEWRMTLMAVLTIPISVLAAIALLYISKQTINVMTLGGLALAIGPMVDSAIICLENTERHLAAGDSVRDSAKKGASEVALPELVASCSTLLVLAPLALMPSSGQFLFKPMALAVAFAMIVAYILSRTFIPSRCASWLKKRSKGQGEHAEGEQRQSEHIQREPAPQAQRQGEAAQPQQRQDPQGENQAADADKPKKGLIGRAFDRWQSWIDAAIGWYGRRIEWVMKHRLLTVLTAVVLLIAMVVGVGPFLRRDYFPEVDAGAFVMYVRAPTGTRIEVTQDRIAEVEEVIDKTLGDDKELIISEIGVWPDWSAAYTPNSGPMDTIIRIQLKAERKKTSQDYAQKLRTELAKDNRFADLEFSYNTGGTIRSALNEGRATPINIRIEGKNSREARKVSAQLLRQVKKIDGVVDTRILQRLDYPEYVIKVNRDKSRELGLTQKQVMECVISAFNSSIQFNKKNFWLDPKSQNQYFVGVQYPEDKILSMETLKNISITSPIQQQAIPLSNIMSIEATTIAAEVTHDNLQTAIDLEMNVHGRDLGHVAVDIVKVVDQFGKQGKKKSIWSIGQSKEGGTTWLPYEPQEEEKSGQKSDQPKKIMEGSKMKISGEYEHMNDTFKDFGIGLVLAIVFVYFLMVSLLDSYLIPLVILSAVPIGLVGVIPMLFLTGTAINVQSLLGVIFMVGIVVSNTVLLTDFAETTRREEKVNPTEAIVKAAKIRARPVVMTAIAALFALLPMALALEKGSEANAPLGRAVIGGLLAGLVTTLIVVPALYSLVVRDKPKDTDDNQQAEQNTERPREEHDEHNR